MFYKFKNLKLDGGVTILEILIVLAILLVLSFISINFFVDFRKSETLEMDTKTVVEVLRQARSQTLLSQNASQYGVHFTSSKITLFVGTVYSEGVATNKDFNLASSDVVLNITLTGGGSDVIFKRLSGETTQNGTITISSPTISKTKIITIYKTGLIESQ